MLEMNATGEKWNLWERKFIISISFIGSFSPEFLWFYTRNLETFEKFLNTQETRTWENKCSDGHTCVSERGKGWLIEMLRSKKYHKCWLILACSVMHKHTRIYLQEVSQSITVLQNLSPAFQIWEIDTLGNNLKGLSIAKKWKSIFFSPRSKKLNATNLTVIRSTTVVKKIVAQWVAT